MKSDNNYWNGLGEFALFRKYFCMEKQPLTKLPQPNDEFESVYGIEIGRTIQQNMPVQLPLCNDMCRNDSSTPIRKLSHKTLHFLLSVDISEGPFH